jgi:hypothetical protein
MIRLNSSAWLLVLLLWPLIGLVALTGCVRKEIIAAQAQDDPPLIYTDKMTGCEYFASIEQGWDGVIAVPHSPRIAADGKTHMGCGTAGIK